MSVISLHDKVPWYGDHTRCSECLGTIRVSSASKYGPKAVWVGTMSPRVVCRSVVG